MGTYEVTETRKVQEGDQRLQEEGEEIYDFK